MDAMKSKKAPKEKQLTVSTHHITTFCMCLPTLIEDNRRQCALLFIDLEQIKVRSPALGDQKVIISNLATIEMVKTNYLSQVGHSKVAEKGAEVSKLRFFCLGKELKDDLFLYSYEVNDNMVVQAMLRQQ